MGKDFSDDLDLELGDELEASTAPHRPRKEQKRPANLREQRRAEKAGAKRKPQTFTVPEDLLEDLREYVLRAKLDGEQISASEVVTQGIRLYLKKNK